jgi:CheY-like chemotaxis protein
MSKRILVLDDDPLVLRSIEKLLRVHGYEVLTACSYTDAMQAISQKEFHLIVSDMPDKDGVSTIKEIQEALMASGKKDLPIIFITGYAGEEQKLNAKFYGETLYKPIDNEKLIRTVQDYL